MRRLRERRSTAIWFSRNRCCRMLFRRTFVRLFGSGGIQNGCRTTRSEPSAPAGTWNESHRSGRHATRKTSLPMPEAEPHLAFDLGAESGRAVLAHVRSGVITTEEIHRFRNQPVEYGGSLHWDAPGLWREILHALASFEGVALSGIGVDAWGVDYALLGERGELLENPYHYRDKRTDGVMELVFAKVSKQQIYRETGIQFMPINTVFQLFAAKRETPELL